MARQTEVSIDVVTMTMMMITTNDDDDNGDDDDDNGATHDSRCQSRPGLKCIDLDGIKPSWARKDFVKDFFISLVYPRQNHDRSSQVYGLSGKLPMFDKWKDSKGLCGSNTTDSPRPG